MIDISEFEDNEIQELESALNEVDENIELENLDISSLDTDVKLKVLKKISSKEVFDKIKKYIEFDDEFLEALSKDNVRIFSSCFFRIVDDLDEEKKNKLLKLFGENNKLRYQNLNTIYIAMIKYEENPREKMDVLSNNNYAEFVKNHSKSIEMLSDYLTSSELSEVLKDVDEDAKEYYIKSLGVDGVNNFLNSPDISDDVKVDMISNHDLYYTVKFDLNNLNTESQRLVLNNVSVYTLDNMSLENLKLPHFKKLIKNKEFFDRLRKNIYANNDFESFYGRYEEDEPNFASYLEKLNPRQSKIVENIIYNTHGANAAYKMNILYDKLPDERKKEIMNNLDMDTIDVDDIFEMNFEYLTDEEAKNKLANRVAKEVENGYYGILNDNILENVLDKDRINILKDSIVENCKKGIYVDFDQIDVLSKDFFDEVVESVPVEDLIIFKDSRFEDRARELINNALESENREEVKANILNKFKEIDALSFDGERLKLYPEDIIDEIIDNAEEKDLDYYIDDFKNKVRESYLKKHDGLKSFDFNNYFQSSNWKLLLNENNVKTLDDIDVINNLSNDLVREEFTTRLKNNPENILKITSIEKLYESYKLSGRESIFYTTPELFNNIKKSYEFDVNFKYYLKKNPEQYEQILSNVSDEKFGQLASVLEENEYVNSRIKNILEDVDNIKYFSNIPKYVRNLEDQSLIDEFRVKHEFYRKSGFDFKSTEKLDENLNNKVLELLKENSKENINSRVNYILEKSKELDNEKIDELFEDLSVSEKLKTLKLIMYETRGTGLEGVNSSIISNIVNGEEPYLKDDDIKFELVYNGNLKLEDRIKLIDKVGVDNVINSLSTDEIRYDIDICTYLGSKSFECEEKININNLRRLNEVINSFSVEELEEKINNEYKDSLKELKENNFDIITPYFRKRIEKCSKEHYEELKGYINDNAEKTEFIIKVLDSDIYEDNKEKINYMLESNNNEYYFKNIDLRLFGEEFKSYTPEFTDALVKNDYMKERILSGLDDGTTKNFNKMLASTLEGNSFEEVIPVISKLYEKVYDEMSENNFIREELTDIQVSNLKEYFLTNDNELDIKIKSLEDLAEYKNNINELLDNKFKESNTLEEKMNIFCNKYYSMTLGEMEYTKEKYKYACEALSKDNKDYRNTDVYQFYDSISKMLCFYNNKYIKDADKENILNDFYNELADKNNITFSREDYLIIDEKIKEEIAQEMSNSLYKVDYDKEPDGYEQYYDENIPVIEIKDNFKLLVHAIGAYGSFDESDGYYESWNNNQNIDNQRVCCSLVSNQFIGTADVKGVVLGFDGFDKKALEGEAPMDLYSLNKSLDFRSYRDEKYYTTDELINSTRSKYNEVNINRKNLRENEMDSNSNIQPSYVIMFNKEAYGLEEDDEDYPWLDEFDDDIYDDDKESYNYYWEQAIQCAHDFNIPILYVDKKMFEDRNKEEIESKLDTYNKENNIEQLIDATTQLNNSSFFWVSDISKFKDITNTLENNWDEKIKSISNKDGFKELSMVNKYFDKEIDNYEHALGTKKCYCNGFTEKNIYDVKKNLLFYNKYEEKYGISTASKIDFKEDELKDINYLKHRIKEDKDRNYTEKEMELLDRKITYGLVQMQFREMKDEEKYDFFEYISNNTVEFLYDLEREEVNSNDVLTLLKDIEKIENGNLEEIDISPDSIEALKQIKKDCEECQNIAQEEKKDGREKRDKETKESII